MKIALTVWEDRISPVFDVANRLLLADIKQGRMVKTSLMEINPGSLPQLVEIFKRMGISVLICGAISEIPANIISDGGIQLIPFISGKTDHILDAYIIGKPIMPAFAMPGVKRCRRRRGQLLPLSGNEPNRGKRP